MKMKKLLRVKSHRAYDKLKKTGIPVENMFVFGDGYYYRVDESDVEEATKITGICLVKREPNPEKLIHCWR